MKHTNQVYLFLTVVFLASSITGCSLIQSIFQYESENTPVYQSEEVPKDQQALDPSLEADNTEIDTANRFDDVSFPQESCGDPLPEDHRVYPVEAIRVGIPYSEQNLALVKKHFCKDAFKRLDSSEQNFIQVASFFSREKLSEFSEILKKELGEIEVRYMGSTVIESKPNYIPPENSSKYIESVAEGAKLTPVQAEKLISVGKVAKSSSNLKFTLGIVVPTYIPPGFKVDELFVSYYEEGVSGGMYSLTYWNPSNNSCFSISGLPDPPIGDGPSGYDQVKIISSDLGEIVLEYTNSDGFEGIDYISTYPSVDFAPFPSSFHAYDFNSPGSYAFDSPKNDRKCKSVSLPEAVKIAESLRYLNP